MVTVHKGFHSKIKTTASVAFVAMYCLLAVSLAGAAEVRQFANGITATIYGAEELAGDTKSSADGSSIEISTPNGTVQLTGDSDQYVPFDFTYVERALAHMSGLNTEVDVTVYILPSVPLVVGSSFARQDAIYLAPGTGPVDETTVAYITTHEMGHVLTWAFMDSHPARWEAYMQMRGLDPVVNGDLAAHADRAREILAEDIRFLFGGHEATISYSIENHDLILPTRVAGLKELLAGFFADRDLSVSFATATAFPNPCNPLTTIAMAVPAGSMADGYNTVLRVFDIRGALVKTIAGGNLANDRITIQWNGTTDSGNAVASGRYLYVMQSGDLVAKGNVTLVR